LGIASLGLAHLDIAAMGVQALQATHMANNCIVVPGLIPILRSGYFMTSMESELRLNEFMRSTLRSMMDTVPEAEFYELPVGGGNSPGWILGHLVLVNRFGLSLLGGDSPDSELLRRFGPGSSPEAAAENGPGKRELLAAEDESAKALRQGVLQATSEQLSAPQQSPFLNEQFPRVGDMLSHILVSHLSMHVGQLSAWRRARGMPPILQIGS
jgi:hypothetical protein